MGFSAGAMLMSKYIIIIPCTDFHIEKGLNFDNGTDISIIKSSNDNIKYYVENNGKIWK